MVLLQEDSKETRAKLEALAKKHKLTIPLTINAKGKEGPRGFKLNDKVKHTVLVYKGKKVAANFALNDLNPDSVKAIVAAAKKNAG